MKKIVIVALALVPLSGMASTYDAQFAQIVPLCEELFFPNAQAMDPGVDVDAELRQLEKQIKTGAARFHTRDGVDYLNKRLATEQDNVARACIERLLDTLPASKDKPAGK